MTTDWESFVWQNAEHTADELELQTLARGDTLRIVTEHTHYVFRMLDSREAELEVSRADRPRGRVRLSGCGFAFASTFKPGRIFCGGRLEFTFCREEKMFRFRTTAVVAIYHSGRLVAAVA